MRITVEAEEQQYVSHSEEEWFDGKRQREEPENEPDWKAPARRNQADSLELDLLADLRAVLLNALKETLASDEVRLKWRKAVRRSTSNATHSGSKSRRRWQDVYEAALQRAARQAAEAARTRADSEQTFRELVEWWKEDTLYMSSVTRMATHPAYQRIIGMGPVVLPLLLSELEQTRDHWLWALNAITGKDPAPEEANFDEAVDAWLAWGKERGYL